MSSLRSSSVNPKTPARGTSSARAMAGQSARTGHGLLLPRHEPRPKQSRRRPLGRRGLRFRRQNTNRQAQIAVLENVVASTRATKSRGTCSALPAAPRATPAECSRPCKKRNPSAPTISAIQWALVLAHATNGDYRLASRAWKKRRPADRETPSPPAASSPP